MVDSHHNNKEHKMPVPTLPTQLLTLQDKVDIWRGIVRYDPSSGSVTTPPTGGPPGIPIDPGPPDEIPTATRSYNAPPVVVAESHHTTSKKGATTKKR